MNNKLYLMGLDNIDINKIEEYKSGERLFFVGMTLNCPCNYKCVYCGISHVSVLNKKIMTRDEYFDIIDQASTIGVSSIALGGLGEPTMSKYIIDILKYVNEKGMTPILYTNASLFGNDDLCQKTHNISGKKFLDIVDKCGTTLIISCDTINTQKYDEIVGNVTDAFKYFNIAIERIKESNLVRRIKINGSEYSRIAISSVIMPNNYIERFDLVQFAHSLNGIVILKVPSRHGSAADNEDKMFSIEESKDVAKELERLTDKKATLQVRDTECAAWNYGINISIDGNYTQCMSNLYNPYGKNINIRNTSLFDVLKMKRNLVKSLSTAVCPFKAKQYT